MTSQNEDKNPPPYKKVCTPDETKEGPGHSSCIIMARENRTDVSSEKSGPHNEPHASQRPVLGRGM